MSVRVDDLSETLTKIELALRWKISTRTLERWRSENDGPVWMTLGGSIRYRLADVLSYEAQHRSIPARIPDDGGHDDRD